MPASIEFPRMAVAGMMWARLNSLEAAERLEKSRIFRRNE
jgi:hypothetical protein